MARIFGALALLVAIALVAVTTDAGAQQEGKKKQDFSKQFAKMDADGNGKLTKAELKAAWDQRLEKAKDAEAREKMTKQMEGVMKRFQGLDASAEGITLEQFTKLMTPMGKKKKDNQNK